MEVNCAAGIAAHPAAGAIAGPDRRSHSIAAIFRAMQTGPLMRFRAPALPPLV